MFRRIASIVLAVTLIFQQAGFAQMMAQLDVSRYLAPRSAPAIDSMRPLQMRYFSFDPLKQQFDLLVDKGSLKNLNDAELKDQAKAVFDYFLIGLSLPNEAFWVNLRPDSDGQIIDEALARTDVGKIMLEADVQLKKDTAMLTSPNNPEGKEYWDRLYRKAGELFGLDNITIPTLTRPWIVPGEVIVRYTQDSAYVYKSTLKVMLEQDYLKDSATYNFKDARLKELNEYSSQLIRELIIPVLTKEINTAKRYASLRQVFYSLILAQCFKAKFSDQAGAYAKRINSRDLTGLTSAMPWSKTTYFKEYQKSFKDGEYNIKAPVSTIAGQSIRSYFSGGVAPVLPAAQAQAAFVLAPAGAPDVTSALKNAGLTGVRIDDNEVRINPPANKSADSAKSAGFEGLPNESYNADLNAAIRPPRMNSFARKITILAGENSAYRTAEGRRNVKQQMRKVLDKVEENILTVVFGKEFEGGKQVVKRGSADANLGWTDAIRELDPEGAAYLLEQKDYTQQGFAALMRGDYQAFANYTNLYVESRTKTSKRWLSLMLQARKGEIGLPVWVYSVYKMIMDNPNEYGNFIHLFEDIDAGNSPADYDLYAPGEIGVAMNAALEFNILHAAEGKAVGVFALGAGGAGSVCALIGTSRQVCLEFLQFLRETRGIVVPRLLSSEEAKTVSDPTGIITKVDLEQLTTGAKGSKYEAGRHRLAFWVAAKADVDGVKIDLNQWNEASILKEKGLTLTPPADLPWVIINKNNLKVLPIESVVDEQGDVRPEFSENEWVVVKDWNLGFDHNKYFRLDRPLLAEENVQFIRDRIAKNGFQGVFPELWKWAKVNNKKIFISVPARWLDIVGSSWDLKDFRLYGTPEGDMRLDLLPSCNAIPSEYRLDIEISAIGESDIIEYVAPQYFQGTHRVNPNKVEYLQPNEKPKDSEALIFVKHPNPTLAAQGIWIIQRKEKDVPALFARLFSVSGGVRFTVQRMDIVPRQGGMESGNAQADLTAALFSMLTGANFSVAEVSYISHVAQMGETNTLTGNQGADAAWAGAGLHVYMGGVYDMKSPRPFAAVSVNRQGDAEQVSLRYEMYHPVWGVNHSQATNTVSEEVSVEQQAIQLTAAQLAVLQGAMHRLSPSAAAMISNNTLIFLSFKAGQTAHRSLGRSQIEVDISLLEPDEEDDLALRLWHEAMERQLILYGLQILNLRSEFDTTLLNPKARETTMVIVSGQQMTLAQVVDRLSVWVHNRLGQTFGSSLEGITQAEMNFIVVNLKAALTLAPGVRMDSIDERQFVAAAERILFLTVVMGNYPGSTEIPWSINLTDINSAFSVVQSDVRLITQGGLPVTSNNNTGPGGVDFRYISMITQFEKYDKAVDFKMPDLAVLKQVDLISEKQKLQKLTDAGIKPSGDRYVNYLAAYYSQNGLQAGMEETAVCLTKLFKIEEEEVIETDPQLKSFLYFLESRVLPS